MRKIKKVKKVRRKFKYVGYGYLCNTCLAMLETPCFRGGECPECGSKSKEILYIKVEEKNENGEKKRN